MLVDVNMIRQGKAQSDSHYSYTFWWKKRGKQIHVGLKVGLTLFKKKFDFLDLVKKRKKFKENHEGLNPQTKL